MLAYDYPLGGVFLSMLYFFLFFIWIWILITVFMDIFRSPDLNGWIKALVVHLRDHPPVPRRLHLPDRPGRKDAGAQAPRRRPAEAGLRLLRPRGCRDLGWRRHLPAHRSWPTSRHRASSPTPSSSHKRPRFWLRADTRARATASKRREWQMAEDNGSLGPISYLVVEFPEAR